MKCVKIIFILIAISVIGNSSHLLRNYDNSFHEEDADDLFSRSLYSKFGHSIQKFVKMRRTMCRVFKVLCDSKPNRKNKPFTKTAASLPNLVVEQKVWFEPSEYTEATGRFFLETLNEMMQKNSYIASLYGWNLATNITSYNQKMELKIGLEISKFYKASYEVVNKFPWRTFSDPDLKRQFSKYAQGGTQLLSEQEYQALNEDETKMIEIYSTAKVCEYKNPNNCALSLDPDLTSVFQNSNDPEELKHYWVSWRDASGKKARDYFKNSVYLMNRTAHLANFSNAKEKTLFDNYEDVDFESEVKQMWSDVKPLYEELHAYVRRLLSITYGFNIVNPFGPIPAHLLGNMWAQEWGNIYSKTKPYEKGISLNVLNERLKKDYKVLDMVKIAEKFYMSINFTKLPDSFYENSIFEKLKDRKMVCHANAWDMGYNDYRIKMCAVPRSSDFHTIHHEMGHIYYDLHYKNQPFVYRGGANSGFHEAIGDTIDLSINPIHLHDIGLIPETDSSDYMSSINYLYFIALRKIPMLPFAYIMDLWRWKVYTGEINPENYNYEWWKLRYEYQGVEPPVVRSEEDFDPAAKFHIAASVPYIRYFAAIGLQFHFHRTICINAGLYDASNPKKNPLHYCDISKSPGSGNAFGEMLAKGASKPWRDTLESFTGYRTINAKAILEYFAPLYEWLKEENRRYKVKVGWKDKPMRTGCKRRRN